MSIGDLIFIDNACCIVYDMDKVQVYQEEKDYLTFIMCYDIVKKENRIVWEDDKNVKIFSKP